MPLVEVELPVAEGVPDDVRALLSLAGLRMEEFFARRGGAALAGFVPGDFERVYPSLRGIVEAELATGDAFLEWGSGFGVVAMLAARLGFQASGIEIHPELVDEAEALAEELGIDVEFACGTFVPRGGEDLADAPQEFGWLLAGGGCGHEALGVDPSDFDVVFAYPWPGEEQVIEDLFERFAATGALLLTFHGYEDIRLRRRVSPED